MYSRHGAQAWMRLWRPLPKHLSTHVCMPARMYVCMYVGNLSMDLLASMKYLACLTHHVYVTLVLIKE